MGGKGKKPQHFSKTGGPATKAQNPQNNNNNNNNNNANANEPLPSAEGYKVLDGSILEGGGQILRNSFSLAALLGIPIQIKKIRAGRDRPGLKTQHLKGIELINQMYQGTLIGGKLNSTEVSFKPGQFKPMKYEVDTQTAGSVCLLAQVALPCLIFTPTPETLILKGGTNADAAPPVDYLIEILRPYASLFGIKFDVDLKTRGFYPKGGGVVHVHTNPVKELQPINLVNRGKLVSIRALAFTTGRVPQHVSARMVAQAKADLENSISLEGVKWEEQCTDETKTSVAEGTMIRLIAATDTGCLFCASAIGSRNLTAEQVGSQAAAILIKNINAGGCVDEYMQDQLIIFMALANGQSHLKIGPMEMHTKTSIHFAELLAGAKFTITPTPLEQRTLPTEDSLIITCDGIGFKNPHLK